jgi:hypothetical protein
MRRLTGAHWPTDQNEAVIETVKNRIERRDRCAFDRCARPETGERRARNLDAMRIWMQYGRSTVTMCVVPTAPMVSGGMLVG